MSTTTVADQVVAQLYDEHAPAVLRYLKRLTGSHEEAEDVAQEMFLKALRHLGQLEASGAPAFLSR